ncbi:MAG: GNAT family protein [Microbacteriaceae bacterium]
MTLFSGKSPAPRVDAHRPDPTVPLVGKIVTLRQLKDEDLPALFAAIGKPAVFSGGWGGGPANYRADYEEWKTFIRGYLRSPELGNVYVVCLNAEQGRIIGTTTMTDFELKSGATHVGFTAYDPDYWGTGVNAECKLLLLGAAFEHGFERVLIRADTTNKRSRLAIERLGAQYEGIMRHTKQDAEGRWVDSAIYSVLSGEWPERKAELEARLSRHR